MDKNKITSMAKAMKWIPALLGVVSIALAAISVFVKMEDAQAKANILSFASLGIMGIGFIVFGVGSSAILEAVGELPQGKEEDDKDIDILA